jgi:diguanylate cyclase (GGDEF)-like protein
MATILVIEDSEGQRAEVRAALETSGLFEHILEAHDGIQGLKLLLSACPDLVLCDLDMPGLDGEKLLRMREAVGDAENPMPFLVLTATTDPERRARLLEEGASDAITKPFCAADLIARVALHLKLLRTQRELIEKNLELQRLARTDALTGLANRRQIDEFLAAEFGRAQRTCATFVVAMADIDHFKTVNDAFGHAIGDVVLTRIAEATRALVRETDCAARYGGEEWLVVLCNNDVDGAQVFAERWRRAVEAIPIEVEPGKRIAATISVGLAAWNSDHEDPEQIVREADAALYRAKAAGRNRVCCYSSCDGDADSEARTA